MPRKPNDGSRPFKPRDGRPPRREGARPPRRERDGPEGERPRGEGPKRFGKPRPEGERPRGERPKRFGKPRPEGERPARERSGERFGGERAGKPRFDKRPRRDRTGLPRPPQEALPEPVAKERERIAKVVARAGLGSRREIEEWIAAGRVAVNGEVLTTPAFTVTAQDRIEVDGAPLQARERTRLFLFHKPRGLVTTTDDPEGRPTVFDVLPSGLPRLVSVGRLDVNTEGLLLLTNDGGLARVLELPETGWLRRYRVRAFGDIAQAQLDALRDGVEIDGFRYGPIEATLDREQGSNVWLTVALREGKKREIRTVLGHLGVHVNRLIRVSFGPFQLAELAEGAVEEVKTRVLREQIGERIAALAGTDFDAPVRAPEVEAPPPPPRETRTERRSEAPRRDRPVRDDRPARPRPQPRGERPARQTRPPREERRDGKPGRPPPRGRRKANVWRAAPEGEAVLTRKPRRRREEAPPPAEDTRPKRAGLLSDRKGRRVLVERIAASEPATPAREERRPPRGVRPFKPRGERSVDKPRGDRPFGKRPPGGKPRGPRRPPR